MRAAVLTGLREVRVEDRPEPEARPGWVVVQVESASLCGTDAHQYDGRIDTPFPRVPGHDFAGRVASVGDGNVPASAPPAVTPLIVALLPAGPVRPMSPFAPVSPFAPAAPAGPASPFAPGSPLAPVAPAGPAAPTALSLVFTVLERSTSATDPFLICLPVTSLTAVCRAGSANDEPPRAMNNAKVAVTLA